MVGKTLFHFEFITYLLAGLEYNFDLVVTSITIQVDPLSPPQVYNYFLTHEAHLSYQLTNLIAFIDFSANFSFKIHPGHSFCGRGSSRGY